MVMCLMNRNKNLSKNGPKLCRVKTFADNHVFRRFNIQNENHIIFW